MEKDVDVKAHVLREQGLRIWGGCLHLRDDHRSLQVQRIEEPQDLQV